jgi:small subunit ribosomal protein S10
MIKKITKKLKPYDKKLFYMSGYNFLKNFKTTGAVVTGPIPLPTNKKNIHSITFTTREQKIS